MKILLIIVIGIVLLFITVYGYLGGLNKVNIYTVEQGGETVVYEDIVGDYKQSGGIMDKLYYMLLQEDKIETYKGYGKFYDDPREVEKTKLRSEAGCILEEKDLQKSELLTHKYKIKTLPVQQYICAEFPYKNKMSVMMSIMKVYPALAKYARENNLPEKSPVIEIYDVPAKKIHYRKEI